MKWSELSDKDKTKLLLGHLYDYYFVEDEQYVARNRGKLPEDFHWPIAWWNEIGECWQTRGFSSNWDTTFNPLQDMNDTWQIVERIMRIPQSLEEAERAANTRFMFWWEKAALWAERKDDAADAICLAALKACGVGIDRERKQDD